MLRPRTFFKESSSSVIGIYFKTFCANNFSLQTAPHTLSQMTGWCWYYSYVRIYMIFLIIPCFLKDVELHSAHAVLHRGVPAGERERRSIISIRNGGKRREQRRSYPAYKLCSLTKIIGIRRNQEC